MNHKLESTLPGKISTTSDIQVITTLMAESEEDAKSQSEFRKMIPFNRTNQNTL